MEEERLEVVNEIFDAIAKESDALQELSYLSLESGHYTFGYDEKHDGSNRLTKEIYNLGESIYNQLKHAGAYKAGKLLYQQSNWIGYDLIVQRLDSTVQSDFRIGETIEQPLDEIPF